MMEGVVEESPFMERRTQALDAGSLPPYIADDAGWSDQETGNRVQVFYARPRAGTSVCGEPPSTSAVKDCDSA